VPDEARVVRQVFAWVGRDRLTIGEVCRRLTQAGEVTRTGKTVWDRSVVWGMLKNPAYRGMAAFGKTQQGPLRPRLRAQRRRPLQPRRAISTYDVPPAEWLGIPVPALVEPERFAAVQEQLQENQRHARQSPRGARYLLQGVVQCQQCGDAYYGKRLSPRARKGHPRAYAYYRCWGTDAYRFGGERVCQNAQVRTDRLDLAVWQEVCALLAQPARLAEEYRRRLHPDSSTKHTTLTTLEAQLGKLRQGLARLIDSYTAALIEKHEFEPRITRLRQRIAHVEAHRQQLAEEAALHTDLRLIIGRLEDFAAQVQEGLVEADWSRQREMIRALVKRVEVAHDQVNVVFRIDPRPGDPSPEKKSLQDCRRSTHPPLRGPGGWLQHLPICIQHPRLEPRPDAPQERAVLKAFCQPPPPPAMIDGVEEPLDVCFYPKGIPPDLTLHGQPGHGVHRPHMRTVSLATAQAILLVEGLPSPRDGALPPLIFHGGDSSRASLAMPFRHVLPSDEFGAGALPLEALHAGVHVLVEMALLLQRAEAVHPLGGLLAAVPPALLEKRLVAQRIEVAEPLLGVLLGLLRYPLQEG
jgi:site-specific DNA recombinase